MATIGVSASCSRADRADGVRLRRLSAGGSTRPTPGSRSTPSFHGGLLINKLDVWGGVIAGVLVAVLALFFQYTKTGRALRAVADDHAAAQSVGIRDQRGSGSSSGSSPASSRSSRPPCGAPSSACSSRSRSWRSRRLPVLIIGGFTSVPGAIVGGLIVGAGEKLAEIYLGPLIGGGIEYWFAYVVALAVLMVRPQGSVWRAASSKGYDGEVATSECSIAMDRFRSSRLKAMQKAPIWRSFRFPRRRTTDCAQIRRFGLLANIRLHRSFVWPVNSKHTSSSPSG